MAGHNVEEHKKIAVEFLQMVIVGRIEDAYREHVDMTGKHHNPFFPAGFPELQKAMIENHSKSPNKKLLVKNVLGDGDLVAVHSNLFFTTGEKGMSTVHILRFSGNKITEMWDVGQHIPADSPNKDGAF